MMDRSAPLEDPPLFGWTPDTIRAETASVLESSASLRQRLVASINPSNASFANTIIPLIDDANLANLHLRPITFLASVSADAALRDAARATVKQWAAAETVNRTNASMAALVAAVHDRHLNADKRDVKAPLDEVLDDQDRHLLSLMHSEYVRHGAGLVSDDARSQFRKDSAELQEVLSAARQMFTEARDGIWLTRSDLAGVPETVLGGVKQAPASDGEQEDKFWVTFRNSHYPVVMRHAVNANTRLRLYRAKETRFPDNIERLSQIVELRDSIARQLQYENHADLRVEEMMAESVSGLRTFLEDFTARLGPVAQQEIERMLNLKKAHFRETGESAGDDGSGDNAEQLFFWDWLFYDEKMKASSYGFDSQKFSEYFETSQTVTRTLELLGELLGLRFRSEYQTDARVWHPDVNDGIYTVWNNDKEGGGFVGHLYLDIFSREGKNDGAFHSAIRSSFIEASSNKRHYPVSAVVCSFSRPTSTTPSLLQHGQVKTLFHELGHAIHNLVGTTKYANTFSRDFVEIPSNVMENWVWLPEVLMRLGRHHTCIGRDDDSGRLPEDLARSVSRIKAVNQAHTMLTQLHLSLFDLAIHSPEDHDTAVRMDITRLWNTMKQDTIGLSNGAMRDAGVFPGHGQSGFPHIYRTYDAAYFSYTMCKIYAADIFASFFSKDPMSRVAGGNYRRAFLEPGAREPEAKILEAYLGRKPNSDAIFSQLYSSAKTHL